jgi:NADH dehydrogenase
MSGPLSRCPKIVVVGGGAGGLELVTRLGDTLGKKGLAEITLVERNRTHMWKPLLHEVASGELDINRHELDYIAQSHWHHFRYRAGELVGLDRANKKIHISPTFDEDGREITPHRTFDYDILVIAVGSTTNDFGTPGVKEHAIALETPAQAAKFNRRIIYSCYRANTQAEPIRPGQLHVCIIGAGATGTELSASLHHATRAVVAYGLDKIDPDKDLKITLLEAAPRILPALPIRLSNSVRNELERLGVEVRAGCRVSQVSDKGVHLTDGTMIESELVIWAAGVKGPDVLKSLDGLEIKGSTQLAILPTLQTVTDPDIFAIGDCAYLVPDGSDTPLPPRAQTAHQQASHALKQIKLHLKGEPLEPFVYKDFGSLVSLGQYTTVGNLMGAIQGKSMFIEGHFAVLMYRSLYALHQLALHGPLKAFLDILARLITRSTEPPVKLH